MPEASLRGPDEIADCIPSAAVFPASSAQQRLWFLDRLAPDSAAYVLPVVWALDRTIDATALQRALAIVVARHESLRTCFAELDGTPVQVIAESAHVPVQVWVARGRQGTAVQALVERELARPLELTCAPLLRVGVVRQTDDDDLVALAVHHIVCDGWSLGVLTRELAEAYEAVRDRREPRLPRLDVQYADWALWQRRRSGEQEAVAQLAYWRERLTGASPLLALPTDRPRTRAAFDAPGGRCPVTLSTDTTKRLRKVCLELGVTPFMALLAAWALVLARRSDETDIVVGTPMAGRGRTELEPLIGFFVNTLPLRIRVRPQATLAELLGQVRETAVGAHANDDVPFERLVAAIAPERSLHHHPVFQVGFGLQTAAFARSGAQARAPARWEDVHTDAAKFDLTLLLMDHGEDVRGVLEYDAWLFGTRTAATYARQMALAVEALATDIGCRVSAVSLTTGEERAWLLAQGRHRHPCGDGGSVATCFERRAEQMSAAPALRFGGVRLSYGELDGAANRLAHVLVRAGVGPGARVGVCLERSSALVVALLAVAKAGAAYVPLDPDYPAERLAFMVEDAELAAVVSSAALSARIEGPRPYVLLCVDRDAAAIAAQPGSPPVAPRGDGDGDAIAYVMYTSGSTGRPKGVCIPHRAIARLVLDTDYVSLLPGDRVAQASNASFDAMTFELWGALLNGAELVGLGTDVMLDPSALRDTLRREEITTLFVTTALFNQLVRIDPTVFASLRDLLFGGEAVDPASVRSVLAHGPPERLLHVYGPTECTTFATWHLVDEVAADARTVPIGRPIANTDAWVLDGAGELVPPGVVGELWLGGPGLAHGYHGRTELTAQRFVPHPELGRLYRTGDQVRIREDGALEYVGRADRQVKLRGFRIEPGEVESALRALPEVQDAVVAVRDGRLLGWIVPASGATRDCTELRRELKRGLPEYMVPVALGFVAELPMNANGKLDRERLPVIEPPAARSSSPPRTQVERVLASIWSEVLGVEEVGVHDNFFALGGDSILGIRILARAAQAGVRLTPRQLFEHQTISALAHASGGAAAAAAEQGPVTGTVPLTPIQHWFLAHDASEPDHFTQAILLDLRLTESPTELRTMLDELVDHHDALRLRLRAGGEPELGPAGSGAQMQIVDLRPLDDAEHPEAITRHAARAREQLSLADGRMIAAVLFRCDDEWRARLLLVAHHFAVDAVSWRILVEDLDRLRSQRRRGAPSQLPAKTTSVREWARRLTLEARSAATREELSHWLAVGAGDPGRLPVDRPADADANRVGAARRVYASLDVDATRRLLHDVPRRFATQSNDALLSALAQACAAWTGSRRLLVDVEGHGREPLDDLDVSRTVGWFTSLFPLRLDLAGVTSPEDALQAVAEQLRAVPRRGLGFGLLRWLSPDAEVRADLAAMSSPEIAFNYLGRFESRSADEADEADDLTGPSRSASARRAHLLEIDTRVIAGRLRTTVSYCPAMHDETTIQALADRYVAALRALGDAAGIRDCVVEDSYPLAPLQDGLLFHSLLAPDSGQYVVVDAIELDDVRPDALRMAWAQLVERHAILRTELVWQGVPRPFQRVRRHVVLPWSEHDLRGLDPQRQRERLAVVLERERRRGFDLERAPLLRLALLRTGTSTWTLVWSCHHVLLDGWSRAILLADLRRLYAAAREGLAPPPDPPPPPFRAYVDWLAKRDQRAAREFWRAQLAGFDGPTPLPAAASRGGERAGPYADEVRHVTAAATARLEASARTGGVTLNTLVRGAWAIVLSRHAASSDVVFGATVSGRPHELPGVESMVGPFINTVPVRVQVSPDAVVADWLVRLRDEQAQAAQWEFAPLAEIQQLAGLHAGDSLTPTLLVFENYPGAAPHHTPAVATAPGSAEWTHHALTVTASPGRELRLTLTYDVGRYEVAAVERLAAQLEVALDGLADLTRPVRDVPYLAAGERAWLRRCGCGPRLHLTDGADVPSLVADQAVRTPAAVAVCDDERTLDYATLMAEADAVAATLLARGGRPGERIGVYLERSARLVVALLGVLRAGMAYVPLDPGDPAERHERLLAGAQARRVLAPSTARRALVGAELIDIAECQVTSCAAPLPSMPGELAYVLHTSGSSGRPKPVAVGRRALAERTIGTAEHYELRPDDRVLALAPATFDVAAEELWPALAVGAGVVVGPASARQAVAALVELAERQGITVLNLPSSLWQEWVQELAAGLAFVPSALRLVIAGSESVLAEGLRSWRRLTPPGLRWLTAYGTTETTITATIWEPPPDDRALPEDGIVPIGRPVANTTAAVLTPEGDLAPIGALGELWLGGAGVAEGYLGRPDLTRERFVHHPELGRAYRTGDLVRWREDGTLAFVGRIDEQLNVRGHRVEPAEVEEAIRRVDGVAEALVVASGERLVAYIVAAPDAAPDVKQLRSGLKRMLPAYMVPASFVSLSELPRRENGKVDRRRLPAPAIAGQAPSAMPRSAAERAVAAVFAEVLGRDQVGIHDDFFELGGHSLLATRAIARIRRDLDAGLALRALFDHPTVAQLASRLATNGAGKAAVPRSPDRGPTPLSFAQRRLWFMDRMAPGSVAYLVPSAWRVRGELRIDALERALRVVVGRHEMLRTVFGAGDDEEPAQIVLAHMDVPIEERDVRDADDPSAAASAYVQEQLRRPFDLAKGPLLRAGAVRTAAEEHVVVVVVHHIACDGWSIGLLLQELAEAYAALVAGRAPVLAPLPLQYGDWAHWQRESLDAATAPDDLAWWRAHLAGAAPLLALPTDRPRSTAGSLRGGQCAVVVPSTIVQPLRRLCRAEGATLFMALLAAWSIVLARLSGQREVVVGVPVAGRTRPEVEPLIGLFVNTLALRVNVDGALGFRTLLRRVRELSLGAFARQEVPFEKLVEELATERSLLHHPVFQVMLNVLEPQRGEVPAALPGLDAEPLQVTGVEAKFDLTLYGVECGDKLSLVAIYAADLFDAEPIEIMLAQLQGALAQLVQRPTQRIDECSLRPAVLSLRDRLPDPRAQLRAGPAATIHASFLARAAETPDRVAIEQDGRRWTYQELEAASGQLAAALAGEAVESGDVVAVHAARDASLVVALLGVLRAGAAFAVLDGAHPARRLATCARALKPAAWVVMEAAGPPLACAVDGLPPPIVLAGGVAGTAEDHAPPDRSSPHDLAYVAFTSGTSRGVPLLVEGEHAPVAAHVAWEREELGVVEDDRVSLLSGLGHDPLLRDVFVALSAGATLCVPPSAAIGDGRALARWLAEADVTVSHLTPAHVDVLAVVPRLRLPRLRIAVVGGDRLTAGHVGVLRSGAPNVTCVAAYGATETPQVVGAHVIGPNQPVGENLPLGRGVAPAQLLVLNARGRPCGVGELGEIHVRSPLIARGYRGARSRENRRFADAPAQGGGTERTFATGDLGRHLPSGDVVFTGRCDDEVKIRGVRVAPSAVAAVLRAHAGVAAAAVVAHSVVADTRLHAYVVPRPGRSLDATLLRAWLGERLPEAMVPAGVTALAELPRTPNGKLDRAALPPPLPPQDRRASEPPSTATEAIVCTLMADLLGIDRVDPEADFFALGGHSLLATQLLARAADACGVVVPVRAIFATPTARGLAARIDGDDGPRTPPEPIVALPREWHPVQVAADGRLHSPPAARAAVVAAMGGAT